jgi:hypothetical protein
MSEEKSSALALTSGAEEVEIHSIQQALDVGIMVFKSRMFKNVESPEAAAMMLLKARSLGQSGFWGLDNLHVVEGQLGIKADAVLALVLQDPSCEYLEFAETTDEKATLVGKRRGRPEFRYTYTIEDAKRALLLDRGETEEKRAKSNWNRYRKNMLRARCVTDVARMYFPGATKGMRSVEELHDEGRETITIDPKTGEVLAENGKAVVLPTPPAKDWKPEADDLAAKVDAAKSPDDFKAANKAIVELKDKMPALYLDPVIEKYNAARKAAKESAEKTKAAPAAT